MTQQHDSSITVAIERINPASTDLPLPTYATSGSAGLDLRAAVDADVTLRPGTSSLIPTGFKIAIPQGFEGQIRPRSGLALNHGIGILNAPGTIDSDYRGEVKIILTNFGSAPFTIRRGERIAQLVFCPVVRAEWLEVPSVDSTSRGSGGFGHTGR